MARLKLSQWDSVITDCQTALSLPQGTSNMKAHYYLAQAQLSIGDHDSALASARAAHALCAASNDKSLVAVTNAVLRAKRARWDHAERRRVREDADLERDLLRLLRRERDEDVAAAEAGGDAMEARVVREEAERKEERLRVVLERAREAAERRREVPDWAVDDISFGIMVDPVIVSFLLPWLGVLNVLTRAITDQDWKVVRTLLHHGAPETTPFRPVDARTAAAIRTKTESRTQAGLRGVSGGEWLGG